MSEQSQAYVPPHKRISSGKFEPLISQPVVMPVTQIRQYAPKRSCQIRYDVTKIASWRRR